MTVQSSGFKLNISQSLFFKGTDDSLVSSIFLILNKMSRTSFSTRTLGITEDIAVFNECTNLSGKASPKPWSTIKYQGLMSTASALSQTAPREHRTNKVVAGVGSKRPIQKTRGPFKSR